MSALAKNIVFDWNGTLLDDIHAMHACTNLLLEKEGHKPISVDHFRDHYTIPFESLYRNMGFDANQVEKLMRLENSAFHDHYEPMVSTAHLRKGAHEVLQQAKKQGVHSFILSNHLIDPIRIQLKRLGVENLFAEVLAYADRATQFRDMTKGERLRRYMEGSGMKPQNTIIVGDSAEEIHIAREQGLISVAITGGCVSEKRLTAEDPDYVIHSLLELQPIFQERGFA